MKQFILRQDPAESQKHLVNKDFASFWKRLPAKIFDDDITVTARTLLSPQKLMGQLVHIQETRDGLESKAQLFSGDSDHKDFTAAIIDYFDFYDSQVKPQLIHFAQEFK